MDDQLWAKAGITLAKLIPKELRRFAKENRDAKVTKLVLAVDAKSGDIDLAFDVDATSSWDTSTFLHPRFTRLHEQPAWEPYRSALASGSDADRAEFLDAATAALEFIRSEGIIDELRQAPGFECLVRDRGETEAHSRDRLRRVCEELEAAAEEDEGG